jgi:hypothetical protein
MRTSAVLVRVAALGIFFRQQHIPLARRLAYVTAACTA